MTWFLELFNVPSINCANQFDYNKFPIHEMVKALLRIHFSIVPCFNCRKSKSCRTPLKICETGHHSSITHFVGERKFNCYAKQLQKFKWKKFLFTSSFWKRKKALFAGITKRFSIDIVEIWTYDRKILEKSIKWWKILPLFKSAKSGKKVKKFITLFGDNWIWKAQKLFF